MSSIDLTEATITDLKHLLDSRIITSVELVTLYLRRIGIYDTRGPRLNSVCVLNPRVYDEAQLSDDLRASGKQPRLLEGIPFTVKDCFRVKGLTVAAASPAFAKLEATSDAAVVEMMRAAGAIVLGKTNMPPMADGGCQRGLYGRSESPYNPEWLSTAYASGSSYGSGVSTTATLAAFGFAGESVTSGRSPASNNALVAYTSSRGMLPARGQWPLYPTCDLAVPHTKTMTDLFHVLNVVVKEDTGAGNSDFWRSQPYIKLPKVDEARPSNYLDLAAKDSLRKKTIAVPRCFIGHVGAKPENACSPEVKALWQRARNDLESLGATVVETDFPVLENYTKQDFPGQSVNVPGLSNEWMARERCEMIAMGWDSFLRSNNDENFPNLSHVDIKMIHPHIAPMDDPAQHTESQNQVRYEDMVNSLENHMGELHDLPECEAALIALEAMRKRDLEDWMDKNGYDLVVFPTNGDVARADSDENYDSMVDALRDGVKYANGGRSLKHLGIPVITVPMGTLENKKMPVGLSFLGKAYHDSDLLKYAYAYEAVSQRREPPPLAPALPWEKLSLAAGTAFTNLSLKPVLHISSQHHAVVDDDAHECRLVEIVGTLGLSSPSDVKVTLEVFANGAASQPPLIRGNKWTWKASLKRAKINDRFPATGVIPRDQFMIQILAKIEGGRSAGTMLLIN